MTTRNPSPSSGSTCPPDRPADPSLHSASAQVTATSQPFRDANTSPVSLAKNPADRRGSYVGKRRRQRLRAALLDRDRAILASLEMHRFLTSRQVQQFHFTDLAAASAARAARRVLARLERDQLIRALDGRRVGGLAAGSDISTWYLTDAGYHVLHEDASKRYRMHDPTTRFLKHCLAIADVHLAVRKVADAVQGHADVAIEATARRTYPGLGGERQQLTPDLAAVIHGSDETGAFEGHWFIEVDLGTESIPTLVTKCEAYETYRRSGLEQADTGGTFPLVLWVFHGSRADRRIHALQDRVRHLGRLDPQLFCFATGDNDRDTVATALLEGGTP